MSDRVLSGLARLAATAVVMGGGLPMAFGVGKVRGGHYCRVCGCGLKPGKAGRACKGCREAEAAEALKSVERDWPMWPPAGPDIRDFFPAVPVSEEPVALDQEPPKDGLVNELRPSENPVDSVLENQVNPG